MRHIVFAVMTLFLVGSISMAEVGFNKMASKKPKLVQKGEKKQWCPVCGMSLKGFYKTSHTAKTKDGKILQYCSLRCLVLDKQKKRY